MFTLVSFLTSCSDHITNDGSPAGGTRAAAFDPSLPPDSAFVLFGGQTGSDESTDPCSSITSLSVVEVSPIGASAAEVAEFLSGAFMVRAEDQAGIAQLSLTEVRTVRFLRYERNWADGGVTCHEALEFFAHGLLTSDGETLLDFTAQVRASSPTFAQALGIDLEVVGGWLSTDLGDGGAASLLIERSEESRRGWLVVGELQSSDALPLAEFGDP